MTWERQPSSKPISPKLVLTVKAVKDTVVTGDLYSVDVSVANRGPGNLDNVQVEPSFPPGFIPTSDPGSFILHAGNEKTVTYTFKLDEKLKPWDYELKFNLKGFDVSNRIKVSVVEKPKPEQGEVAPTVSRKGTPISQGQHESLTPQEATTVPDTAARGLRPVSGGETSISKEQTDISTHQEAISPPDTATQEETLSHRVAFTQDSIGIEVPPDTSLKVNVIVKNLTMDSITGMRLQVIPLPRRSEYVYAEPLPQRCFIQVDPSSFDLQPSGEKAVSCPIEVEFGAIPRDVYNFRINITGTKISLPISVAIRDTTISKPSPPPSHGGDLKPPVKPR